MKVIFPVVLVLMLVLASPTSAQCPPGGCPVSPVARVASIPFNLAQRAVQVVRPTAAPVARAKAVQRVRVRNLVFRPYR